MLKGYRWLAPVMLALGVGISAPACSGALFSAHVNFGQDVHQRAYDEGYRQGVNHGRDDAQHRRSAAYDRDKEYRNADRGYRREDGDRDGYRDAFREGFRAGYEEAFRQARDADDRDRRR
jgi:flagellar biosynthesis/type III secretory pathway protein FliH